MSESQKIENNLNLSNKEKYNLDPKIDNFEEESIEAPRYGCALSGVYASVLGLRGGVPILHSGAGCGIGHLFGTLYAGGQAAGGNEGGTSTPCSCLVEEHVILGGEEKLRNLVESTLKIFNGDLFVVISGCVPSLIGDDVDAVIREVKNSDDYLNNEHIDNDPIIHVNAPGFKANSFEGYNLFLNAVIDQLLIPEYENKDNKIRSESENRNISKNNNKSVNIFGIVPYNHVFWKGDLLNIKNLLKNIGIEANIIFSESNGLENLRKIPDADYNIVVSPWNGHEAVKKLEDKFNIPYITFSGVPIGAKQTNEFLRIIGDKLAIDSEKVESYISTKEDWNYRLMEYPADAIILVRPHSYFAVAADSTYAGNLTKFLTNELGYLPDIVQITDNPKVEYREAIVNDILENLDSTVKPDIVFEADTYNIRKNLENRPFLFLLSSSLESPTAIKDFGALHISVSFPVLNKSVLVKHYSGYDGGLSLVEDIVSSFVGPL